MKRIFEIRFRHEMDTDADLSHLGEFTDDPSEWAIVCQEGEYLKKLGKKYEIPSRGRTFRFFVPVAGDEKPGNKAYQEYGKQDFKRMQDYNEGGWHEMGIIAEAEIEVSLDGGKNWKIDKLTSGGLWGIESDSGEDYFAQVEKEQLHELKAYLVEYGFSEAEIAAACENTERVESF